MENDKDYIGYKYLEGVKLGVLDSAYLIASHPYISYAGVTKDNYATAVNGALFHLVHPDTEDAPVWILHGKFDTSTEESLDFFEQDAKSPHLVDLGYSMVGWLDGLESRPDNDNLPPIVTLLMAIQYDKEGGYGSSWKGKGEYRGIMSNIDRKYDRLDKMTRDEIEGKIESLQQIEGKLETLKNNTGNTSGMEVGESKVDAIADLANYTLLYMTYVKEKYPKVFQAWVESNVPPYLREKITFL